MSAMRSAKLRILFKTSLIAALMMLSINTCLASHISVGISSGDDYYDNGYYDGGGYYEETEYVDTQWVPGHWRHGYWVPGRYIEYAAPAPVYYTVPAETEVVWYGDRGYRHHGHYRH